MRSLIKHAFGFEARFSHFPLVGLCAECAREERQTRMIDLPLALHIPDGFLSGGVAAVAGVLAIAAVAYALRVANVELDEARVPLLGVLAAFIFAAQMLNFPIAGGTSGHFLGATLAAVLLGPWLACLVMAVVIGVQAFAFADGGITALGANVLNMGVLGALLAGLLVGALVKALPTSRGAFLGIVAGVSWLAVMVGAAATSVELALSDTVPLGVSLPAMLGVHMLIGIGEAVITMAAVAAVLVSRPDLVALAPEELKQLAGARAAAHRPREGVRMMKVSTRIMVVLGLALAVGLATAVSPFASASPDGLEKVAEEKQFLDRGKLAGIQEDSPIPDYAFPGVENERVATGLAGFVGTLAVFAIGYGLAYLLQAPAPPGAREEPAPA